MIVRETDPEVVDTDYTFAVDSYVEDQALSTADRQLDSSILLEDLNPDELGRRVMSLADLARSGRLEDDKGLEDGARNDLFDAIDARMEKLGLSQFEAEKRKSMWDFYIANGRVPVYLRDKMRNGGASLNNLSVSDDMADTPVHMKQPGLWNRMRSRLQGADVAEPDVVDRERQIDVRRGRVIGYGLGALVVAGLVSIGLYKVNEEYVGFDMDPGIVDDDGMSWHDVPGKGDNESDTDILDDVERVIVIETDVPGVGDTLDDPNELDNPEIPEYLEDKVEREYKIWDEALTEQGIKGLRKQELITHVIFNQDSVEYAFDHPVQFQAYLDWAAEWKRTHPGITYEEVDEDFMEYINNLIAQAA